MLVLHYFGETTVFNVCYRLLGERAEAEDLTQDAFIRAYQRLSTFDTARDFAPWMRRVAANLCYNHLKKNRVAQTGLNDELERISAEIENIPEQLAVRNQQRAVIRAAMSALPPHYRITLELRHFQELTYEEMAAELDLPLNTVKSHLFRARKQLAQLLLEQDGDV